MKKILSINSVLYLIIVLCSFCCNSFSQSLPIVSTILSDTSSFYYTNFSKYPALNQNMPVGVFDSGTGGLTVLNAIVTMDAYNNLTHKKGSDGKVDFSAEDFIYLADQANMPYGNYAAMGKTNLLQEHIIKDAQFLLANKYYNSGRLLTDKKGVKAIVVACNTATAYGLTDIEKFLAQSKTNVKVIGVINAGVKGALKTFKKSESGTIGVFATAGTVASNGYTLALQKLISEQKFSGNIQVYSQGGVGIAEAVDEDSNYIDKKSIEPRPLYKGPTLNNDALSIDKTLLDIYGFDFSGYKMLCDQKVLDQCNIIQINSPENYVRFHLVSLLEKMKTSQNVLPLKTLILGCTHYPFLSQEITKVLQELRKVKQNGKYRYKKLLAKKVLLIDPAVNTAQELYEHLAEQNLLNATEKNIKAEFFISIPNTKLPEIVTETNNNQRFTYDYKYGRSAGENKEFIQTVPFSKTTVNDEVSKRIQKQIPSVYELIRFLDN